MLKKAIDYVANEIIDLRRQSTYLTDPKRKDIFLLVGILFIIVWQLLFYVDREYYRNSNYARKDASGFSHHFAKNFIYYYYYLNLFPVTTSYAPLEYSEEGARKSVAEHGDSLLMEKGHWSRLGESTRILLYMPGAYIKGSAENPSIVPFNAIVFIASLLAVFVAFYFNGMPLLGFFVALIFGSNPFLLHETYNNENYFALIITATLVILALNLVLLRKNLGGYVQWALPVLSGIIVATSATIRYETIVILVCCLIIYLTIPSARWPHKFAFCAVLLISFVGVTKLWQYYFDRKFDEASEVVSKAGGVPYTGDKIKSHTFWHPVYCGLADFDTKYGYDWDDEMKAYKYALPILKEKYHMNFAYKNDELWLDEYYDNRNKYYKKIEVFPEYEEILRDKVLGNIKSDPLWFAAIISKRIWYVFTKTSPVWLGFGKHHVEVPFSGLLIFPVGLFLFLKKKWFSLKLILFTLPLASTPIMIFAKKNTTFNSCFQLLLAALLFAWIGEVVFVLLAKSRKRRLVDVETA